jgi:Flp pilus assembly protein TadD
MRHPVFAKGTEVQAPVGLADLAPTLAGLLERPFETPAEGPSAIGRDLSGVLRRAHEPDETDIYAESEYPRTFGWSALTALRRGSLKLVAAPRPELYDLAVDPREEKDLAATDPRRAALEARLATLMQGAAKAAAHIRSGLDAETRERLASLGYVSAPSSPAGTRGRPAAPGRDPKDVVGLFREFEAANAALHAGRLEEAARLLEPLVGADPGNAVFRGHLAQAYRGQGDFRRALPLYRRAAADAPGDSDARYNLGVSLQETGKSAEALAALDEAIRLDPRRPEAHNARGIALLALDRPADALAAFEEASALDPREPRAHNNRGNVLRRMGRLADAEEAYRRAADLAPRYADPLNGLGSVEVDRDRPAQALPYFDAALSRAPSFHEVRLNRGIALEMMGDRAGAVAAYQSFLEAAQDDPALAAQRRIATELMARLESP